MDGKLRVMDHDTRITKEGGRAATCDTHQKLRDLGFGPCKQNDAPRASVHADGDRRCSRNRRSQIGHDGALGVLNAKEGGQGSGPSGAEARHKQGLGQGDGFRHNLQICNSQWEEKTGG